MSFLTRTEFFNFRCVCAYSPAGAREGIRPSFVTENE